MPRTPLSGTTDEGRGIIAGTAGDHDENGGGKHSMDCGPYSHLSVEGRMQRLGEDGRQAQTVTVLAAGIKPDGHHEILRVDTLTSDDASAWTGFLRGLVDRRLTEIRLVVAEWHPGLKEAMAAGFADADWQRCRVRALRDLLMPVPEPARPLVAAMVGSIYTERDPAAVRAQHARVVEQLREGFPPAAAMLEEAGPHLLAFTGLSMEHWPQVWATNPRPDSDTADRVGILHHHPNFFVLTTFEGGEPRRGAIGAAPGRPQPPRLRQPTATTKGQAAIANAPASDRRFPTSAFLSTEELRALYYGESRSRQGPLHVERVTARVAQATNAKQGGEANGVAQTAAAFLNPPASLDTPFQTGALLSPGELHALYQGHITTRSGHLQRNLLTAPAASTIGTLADVSPGRAGLIGANPALTSAIRVPDWFQLAIVVAALAIAFAAHATNLFFYPRYELDEGTYMSSAWAILNGQITAYPYGYGHPPLGWMQIAAWVQLTGGFFTFGNALNSGRVLMLLYALGSSWLVYLIAQRMSGRRAVGLLAMILFSFSPLSLVYQRQVFLDNIGVFWLLLCLFLIVAGKSRLLYIVAASLAFGCALLSKETFLVLVPVMILAMWLHTTRYQHTFGMVAFTYTAVALGSTFVLMAILKDELFPYAWHLPWDGHPHLSLLDTFAHQALRTQTEGRLGDSWYTWTHADPLLMMLGIAAPLLNVVLGLRNLNQLFLALAALSYWALLLRGGVVLSFYIIVLIPLVALNVALAVHTVVAWIRQLVRIELVCTLLIVGIAGSVLGNDVRQSENAFTQHATSAQTQSMVWVRSHVAHNAVVVINSYLYLDLRQPGGQGVGDGATYPYAHVYWNIAYDPELHDGLLQNNWNRIDYIVADSEMMHDITTGGGPMSLIYTALQHSIPRAEFRASENDREVVISVFQVMHKSPPPLSMYTSSG